VGVNIHFNSPKNGEMQMISQAHFKFIRNDFTWQTIESKKGIYNFAEYDVLVSNLDQFNTKALFIFDYTNTLYDNNKSPYTKLGREAFANYSVAGAKRYAGKGFFWEVYNEPNIFFWTPKPDPLAYSLLVNQVCQQLKRYLPHEMLLAPGTSTFDFPFIETTFKNGILNCIDAVSVHPYRAEIPETVTTELVKLRALINQYTPKNRTNIPIVISEWGYSELYANMTLDKQGKILPRSILSALAADVNIILHIWYDWHDDGTDAKELEHHFGTVYYPYFSGRNPVYDKKPAYTAAQVLNSLLRDNSFNATINSPQDDISNYLLRFVNVINSKINYAVWTTGNNSTILLQDGGNIQPGQCFNIVDYLGKSWKQICSDTSGCLSVPLTDAPSYILS